MAPVQQDSKLLVWGAENIETEALLQAARASRLPFVPDHVALMPDAHAGIGATVGSVIPTENAIIPAAVGVDIGCGMIATETTLTGAQLPDLHTARSVTSPHRTLMSLIEERIPAGVGQGHQSGNLNPRNLKRYDGLGRPHTGLDQSLSATAERQFGSLGSGNHFVEVCLDERDVVWTVLHSGSRGIGNKLAGRHIADAKGLMKRIGEHLEDPDLAYFTQGTPEFDAYITDMLWAQRYAAGSRQIMADALNRSLFEITGQGSVARVINCHHNFTQRETHGGRELWITRKGAIKSDVGDWGVIPGSMGARSYIVQGLGNPASYNSSSHGAGRTMSRSKARKTLTAESLTEAMGDRVWGSDRPEALLDEHPAAYKPIEQVMAAQADLVQIAYTLRQIFNYKGA
jgi:RNA-splicing ligase RtcB